MWQIKVRYTEIERILTEKERERSEMCRCVYLLVLIFSIFRRGLTSSSDVTVLPGKNVTLHCNIPPHSEMFWYQQINDELTVIISATKGNLNQELAVDYNKDTEHFQHLFQNDSRHNFSVSLSLTIVDIRQSDIGLYYCGVRQKGKSINFGRAVYLHFTDVVKYTPGSVQCWTTLISVCCALALMFMLCLGVIYKQGLPSCFRMNCMKDDAMKDADLQYASLRHSATPQERRAPPAHHNVTYDTVATKVNKSPRV
ncbi:uncharacterized protein LOC132882172 [Neoarius graeffei]|uniref:uncharacterized protein LOC132882172 n=1 Tax=Neoarius graeffei TaxID=443677 RepID=UPI00298BE90E|nr:uncharacterized protein LOC132882172 [Neoarius graeffei]